MKKRYFSKSRDGKNSYNWPILQAKFNASGLSIKEFAELEGIPEKTAYQHLRRKEQKRLQEKMAVRAIGQINRKFSERVVDEIEENFNVAKEFRTTALKVVRQTQGVTIACPHCGELFEVEFSKISPNEAIRSSAGLVKVVHEILTMDDSDSEDSLIKNARTNLEKSKGIDTEEERLTEMPEEYAQEFEEEADEDE